jgi:glutamyl-tRNA synthetase
VTGIDVHQAIPVGRLAPSPTGELHLGHARSFLIAWWHARSRGGLVRLRMEDLDDSRATASYEALAQRDLEWLGLDWDGPVVRQTERLGELQQAAQQLLDTGHAYPCVCTRGDIRSAVSAPHGADGVPPYPGTCRDRFSTVEQAEAETGKLAGLRFRVAADSIRVDDRFCGVHNFDLAADPGDFLIVRRDKVVAYQLSVVVDDAHQGVTEIVRGDDLLPSTPRQMAVARALGLASPDYYHLPLVVDASGNRLAKRTKASSLKTLREQSADPRCIVSWVATTCGLNVPPRVSARDVVPVFDMNRVPSSPVRIDAVTIRKWISF